MGPLSQDTLEKCGKCGEVVREHIIRALGRAFHPACFTCVTCARCIGDENFALDSQNEVYCLDDFYRYEGAPGSGWGGEDRVGLGQNCRTEFWVQAFLQKPGLPVPHPLSCQVPDGSYLSFKIHFY